MPGSASMRFLPSTSPRRARSQLALSRLRRVVLLTGQTEILAEAHESINVASFLDDSPAAGTALDEPKRTGHKWMLAGGKAVHCRFRSVAHQQTIVAKFLLDGGDGLQRLRIIGGDVVKLRE